MDLYSSSAISTSVRSPLSASSARSLVSFFFSSASSLFPRSVTLFSLPSRQVWAIHSDVRLTPSAFCCESQKDRERGERERARKGEEGVGGEKEIGKNTKKDKPQLRRGKEKREVNKRDESERKKKSLKSSSHSERCSAPGTRTTPSSILSDLPLRSTYFPSLFFFPLPSLPAFLFYYL